MVMNLCLEQVQKKYKMTTKLLPKQEFAQLKSEERKREIDEGIKLAEKVDLLRETAAQEGANLAKFRIESLKVIKEEIDKLISEKDILKKEIAELIKEKIDLKSQIESVKIISN